MMRIRPAHESEASYLEDLSIRSKSYWTYTIDQLLYWRLHGAFEVPLQLCKAGAVQVAELHESQIVGFYVLTHDGEIAELRDLWVEPTHIRNGARIGSTLLAHAIDRACGFGQEAVTLNADPNAVGFYEYHGFRQIGMSENDPVSGRSLPIMQREI